MGTRTGAHGVQEHALGASNRRGSGQLEAWVKAKTERGDQGDRRELLTGVGDEGERPDFRGDRRAGSGRLVFRLVELGDDRSLRRRSGVLAVEGTGEVCLAQPREAADGAVHLRSDSTPANRTAVRGGNTACTVRWRGTAARARGHQGGGADL
jgi:hypothetical protein